MASNDSTEPEDEGRRKEEDETWERDNGRDTEDENGYDEAEEVRSGHGASRDNSREEDPDMNNPEQQVMPEDRRTDNVDKLGRKRENPGPDPDQIGGDPTAGSAAPTP